MVAQSSRKTLFPYIVIGKWKWVQRFIVMCKHRWKCIFAVWTSLKIDIYSSPQPLKQAYLSFFEVNFMNGSHSKLFFWGLRVFILYKIWQDPPLLRCSPNYDRTSTLFWQMVVDTVVHTAHHADMPWCLLVALCESHCWLKNTFLCPSNCVVFDIFLQMPVHLLC